MDFKSLLNAANKNAKKANKTLNELESEVHKEKNSVRDQLEAEKRARAEILRRKAEQKKAADKRKEEERAKSFVIPKKKDEGTVDPNKVKAYFERQEQEKREKAKQAEVEKERLMKLRMQAHGGKATKKLGKHFGLNPIDLQIRFGGNNEHVETLQKRQWREEEELDREADRYRNGVFKALQTKKKVEEQLRPTVKEPHRVSTSKANSLAGLCSRHEKTRDHFSPPRDKDKKKKEPEMVKKKAAPAPPVDFKALMKAAEDISQGKAARVDLLQPKLPSGSNRPDFQKKPSSQGPPRPPAQQYNGKSGNSSSSYGQKDHERDRERQKERERQRLGEKERSRSSPVSKSSKPNGSVDRNNVPDKSSKSAQNNVKKEEKQRKDGRFVKGPTPPPMIPGIVPGKKYLPGDVRYKEAMLIAQKTHHVETSMSRPKNGNSSGSRVDPERERIERVREAERARERERERVQKLKRERQREEMYGAEKVRRVEKMRFDQSRKLQEKERNRNHYEKQRKDDRSSGSYFRGGDDNTDDEDDEEDEYESDMDSFIDDSGDGFDDLERREFEETLRTVNRHYDTDKWSHREKTISERDMVSNYRRIQAEENYSKRAGMREDLIEATKGRSVRL